jgi:outer membrane protein assembly factor BamB
VSRVWCSVAAGLLAVAWAAGPGADRGLAQRFGRGGRFGSQAIQEQSRVHLPGDRALSRGIQRTQQSIAAGEFSEAVNFLDTVLGLEEDSFVDLGGGEFAGLKETARQLIRDLPTEGRQAYEAAFGAAAERMLKSAVESGDAATLQAVAQRYFYTRAGYEAAFLLAMDEADAGRHLSAALTYQQLLDSPDAVKVFDPHLSVRAAASWLAAGDEQRARGVLDGLLARGRQTVNIGGREHRLDSTSEPLTWLRETVGQPADTVTPQERQWLTYRGNSARNGAASGGLPHMRVRWQVRLLGPPQLETLFENFLADLTRSGNITPVAANPLAIGDYVLTRTPHGLLAVDFRTGKRVWRSEPQREPELERLMRTPSAIEEETANPEPARAFARRMWEDYLYGLVSSDGARVYMIRDLPLPDAQDFEMTPFMAAPGQEEKSQANRLSAYELATQGKLVWEIDGAAVTGDLAGAFFLGAPLSVGQSLYVMAEIKGAINLVVLDRTTGEFQWRQPLVNLETNVTLDLRRRLQSAMPSYESGMIVCPTGAGVVVGVDLVKRSLAWAYQYDLATRVEAIYQPSRGDRSARMVQRWLDTATTIVGNRVLLTPPESGHVHCIDLRSGRMLWKQPRGEMTRLACIEGERILLVGNRKLRALRLDDGKSAWKKDALALPRGVSPSGTGFASDGRYFLPLTSAEVIAIDLAEGRIAARAASRDGLPLGNLICHRGAVISQNGEHLDCFDQIDVLRKRSERRLANKPDDVDALRTLGEVAYNEGRLSDAISLLERAYRAAPADVETRDVLAECLASVLDEDFAANRGRLALLRELEDGGVARRMLVLRIEAQGFLKEGDPLASAAACMELYRLAGPADEMLSVGREHQASVSRWVQAQLAAIWENAGQEDRVQLSSEIDREIQKLGDNPRGDQLARVLEFFGGLPVVEPLKLVRARELNDADQSIDSQQLLLDLAKSGDEAVRGEAVARIATRLHEVGLHSLADDYDKQLRDKFANMKVLDGATGLALLDKWKDAASQSLVDWPTGRVDVRPMPASGAAGRVRSPMWGVRLERTDSILGMTSAQLSARGGELILLDSLGREFFTVSLESENQVPYRQPGTVYGVSRGNLLIVSLGRQMAAFNTLATPDGLAPPVLWRVNLGSTFEATQPFMIEPIGPGEGRPGSFRAPRLKEEGKWIGVIGPVTSRGVVFQDQRRLVCVDALSGEIRWSRTDVPQGCDLFGDDRYVFAVPMRSTFTVPVRSRTARIYSAVDGRLLGRSKLPPWHEQLVTRGRDVVCWSSDKDDRMILRSLDALTVETSWQHEFAPGSAVDIDLGRFIAVVEPTGRAIVIDGEDGAVLVDRPVPARPKIEELHLAVSRDSFLLVAKHPMPGNTKRMVRTFNPLDSPVIDGQIFLFDRAEGQMRWSRPADVVQQALLLNQPVDLPFILFASILTSRDGSGGRNTSSVLILDKATGRTLFSDDELPQSGGGQCLARIADAANRQAAVEMAGRTILLQFTKERRPPEPPAMAEVESAAGASTGGLMGIMLKLGGS